MNSSPNIVLLVVNWNGTADTRNCLASISHLNPAPEKVVVIDNGSVPDPTPDFRSEFSWAEILRLPHNKGYTGAFNFGLRWAVEHGADYILCVNNDTLLEMNLVANLIECMTGDSHLGIVGPVVYARDTPDSIISAGCTLDFTNHTCGRPAKGLNPARGRCSLVDYVEGTVVLLKRQVVEDTGGFDEQFFAYLEDADLCRRARAAGWRCAIAQDGRVLHSRHRIESGAASATAVFYSVRNSWLIARRYAAPGEWIQFLLAQPRGVTSRWRDSVAIARSRPPQHRYPIELLSAHLAGFISGILGLTGARGETSTGRRLDALSLPIAAILLRLGRYIAQLRQRRG